MSQWSFCLIFLRFPENGLRADAYVREVYRVYREAASVRSKRSRPWGEVGIVIHGNKGSASSPGELWSGLGGGSFRGAPESNCGARPLYSQHQPVSGYRLSLGMGCNFGWNSSLWPREIPRRDSSVSVSNTPATERMSIFIPRVSDSPLQYPLYNLKNKKSKLKIKKKNRRAWR